MGKSKGQMKSRLSYSAGAFGNDALLCNVVNILYHVCDNSLVNTGDPKAK